MKKNGLILTLCAILIVTLAGCGHSSQNNQSTNKSALSAKMQNDNSESSSSQSQPAHPKVNLGKYQYQVPKKEQASKNYVKNGNLTNQHQFSYDRFGTKQRLTQLTTQPKTIIAGSMAYQINKVRILKNTAKTLAAKQAVEQALNLPNVPDTYYTFVVNYTITNHHHFEIGLNGVNFVKTDQGQTLATTNQLTDSSAGNKISANQSRSFVMTGYLYHFAVDPAKTLTIHFGQTFDKTGQKIDNAPERPLVVNLN